MESPGVVFTPAFLAIYEVFEPLGEGGMGTVYRGLHRELDRPVAIKVLKSSAAADVARFEREGRILAALHHPNILQVYSAGVDGDSPYLVCELVEGETLDEMLARRAPPLSEVLDIGIALAEALQFAHQSGIVHRDVKPANVFIGKENVVKLADFGLARLELGGQALTADSIIIGTPDYMAPEQVAGQHIGPAADQYALGILLYRLLTGELPFQDEIVLERALQRLKAPAPSTRKVRPAVPAVVDQTVRRMLAREPASRYAHMGEVLSSLNELRTHLESFDAGSLCDATVVPAATDSDTVPLAMPRSNPGSPATVVGPRPSLRVPIVGRRTGGQRPISRVPPVPPARSKWRHVWWLLVLALGALVGWRAYYGNLGPPPPSPPALRPVELRGPVRWQIGARHMMLSWEVNRPTRLLISVLAAAGDAQQHRELAIEAGTNSTIVRALQPGVHYTIKLLEPAGRTLHSLTVDTLTAREHGQQLCRKLRELVKHLFVTVRERERAVRMHTGRPGRAKFSADVVESDYRRYADDPLKMMDRIGHAANRLASVQRRAFDPGMRREWWRNEIQRKGEELHLPEYIEDFRELSDSVYADANVPVVLKSDLYKLGAACHELSSVLNRQRIDSPLFLRAADVLRSPQYGTVERPTLKAPHVELWLLDVAGAKDEVRPPDPIFAPGEVVHVHRLRPTDISSSHYLVPGPPNDLYVDTILPEDTNVLRDLPDVIEIPPGTRGAELAASISECSASGFAVHERVGDRATQLAILRPTNVPEEPVYHHLPAGLLEPRFSLRLELVYNRTLENKLPRQPGVLHWIAIAWDPP